MHFPYQHDGHKLTKGLITNCWSLWLNLVVELAAKAI
jgi:hypothetical protein